MESVKGYKASAGTSYTRIFHERPNTFREYVKVSSVIDRNGYMQPHKIFWDDGRVFQIERVKDFFPVRSESNCYEKDCYTVIIKGEERYLFFEHAHELAAGRIGRWFVQVNH